MASFFKRTTFVVGDAPRAAAFYRHVFGMRTWYDNELVPDADFPPAAPAGSRVRLIILEGEDAVIGKLGFLQYLDNPPSRPGPKSTERVMLGETILVFETDDIHTLAARVRETAATIVAGPKDWEVPAVDGAGVIRLTTMSLFDPEGIYMEVGSKR
jgi:catechol 2,3-dioxygenase-like lactoylglutathione lyase family enzyme